MTEFVVATIFVIVLLMVYLPYSIYRSDRNAYKADLIDLYEYEQDCWICKGKGIPLPTVPPPMGMPGGDPRTKKDMQLIYDNHRQAEAIYERVKNYEVSKDIDMERKRVDEAVNRAVDELKKRMVGSTFYGRPIVMGNVNYLIYAAYFIGIDDEKKRIDKELSILYPPGSGG